MLGDQESDELMSLTDTVIAPVGGHVAAEGSGQVSLDGKILKLPERDPHTSQATALGFSPERLALCVCSTRSWRLDAISGWGSLSRHTAHRFKDR